MKVERTLEPVYIGLGSNLDVPRRQLQRALTALAHLPRTRLLRRSRLYRTVPVGPPDQPEYVNAAALLETRLAPLQLLETLQAVERTQGRRRDGPRWGPRTLDLDILLFGARRIASARLQVPHPQLPYRAFVLVPLTDIAPPDLLIPGIGALASLASTCDTSGVRLLG